MKRFIKSTAVILLVLTLLTGTMAAFAADSEKEYFDYSSYVLLGDSVASGWSDVEDRETRFVRVEGSYGAHVADDLGVDVYHPWLVSASEQLIYVTSSKRIMRLTVSFIIQ